MSFDVDGAVTAAGPAGATAARQLAHSGVTALALERARMPRYQSCAGGIPARTAAALDLPITPVIEDSISGFNFTYVGRHGFTRWSHVRVARMVMRDRFDARLVAQARLAGVRIQEGITVRGVPRDGDGFRLLAGESGPRCWTVLGAGGANSVTSGALGLGRGPAQSVSLEAQVRGSLESLGQCRGIIKLDSGCRPWDHAWLFPKRSLLSLGIVLLSACGRDIRGGLRGHLNRLVGYKINSRRGTEPIAGDRAALFGDGAGLADEVSEGGICYAIRSGPSAARHAARALVDGRRRLGANAREADRRLMPELRAARTSARLFCGAIRMAPWRTFRLSSRIPFLWQSLVRVLRCDAGYDLPRARWSVLPAVAATLLRRAEP